MSNENIQTFEAVGISYAFPDGHIIYPGSSTVKTVAFTLYPDTLEHTTKIKCYPLPRSYPTEGSSGRKEMQCLLSETVLEDHLRQGVIIVVP